MKSPLAEGRELKYKRRILFEVRAQSPLAEGRELKYENECIFLFYDCRPSRRGVN